MRGLRAFCNASSTTHDYFWRGDTLFHRECFNAFSLESRRIMREARFLNTGLLGKNYCFRMRLLPCANLCTAPKLLSNVH